MATYRQVRGVCGKLDQIKGRLIQHHLHDRLRSQLVDPDPASRECAIADVIAFYGLTGAGAPLPKEKELL